MCRRQSLRPFAALTTYAWWQRHITACHVRCSVGQVSGKGGAAIAKMHKAVAWCVPAARSCQPFCPCALRASVQPIRHHRFRFASMVARVSAQGSLPPHAPRLRGYFRQSPSTVSSCDCEAFIWRSWVRLAGRAGLCVHRLMCRHAPTAHGGPAHTRFGLGNFHRGAHARSGRHVNQGVKRKQIDLAAHQV